MLCLTNADPYIEEPSLPLLEDDLAALGMQPGLNQTRSQGVQLLPRTNLLWGLDRLDQLSLPLNQAFR